MLTVSDLKSLLSERLAKMSPNLYKVSDQVDAKLMKVGQDILTNNHQTPLS